MMSLLREEVTAVVSQAVTSSSTTTIAATAAANTSRAAMVSNIAGRTAIREASTVTRQVATEVAPRTHSPLLGGPIRAVTNAPVTSTTTITNTITTSLSEQGTGSLLSTTVESAATSTGLLTRVMEPELSLTVREAISQASQQGLEEALDKVRPELEDVTRTVVTKTVENVQRG